MLITNTVQPIRLEEWIMLLNINVEQKHLIHLSFSGPLPNGIVLHIWNSSYTAFIH